MLLAAGVLFGLYQLPWVRFRLEWRLDAAAGVVRSWLHPQQQLPAMGPALHAVPTARYRTAPRTSPTGLPPTPTPTATPLPVAVTLPSPAWEKQDWNNCGPATLAMTLHMYGWGGDQYDISSLVKPDRGDKNVNIDELVFYVRNRAGWLSADYRVGGTLEVLERFLAAGLPVIVERGYTIESDGPDNGWAGHYLLLTGFDRVNRTFIAQDSFIGPDQAVGYDELDRGWQAFNRVYMFIYPANRPPDLGALLGADLDPERNRQRALEQARLELEADHTDAYAWFNLGTNLVYFERYREAAQAYDTAFDLGLPWRFTRYQFGPYLAYFNSGRSEDVVRLADATLEKTAKAEESLLWRGWARFRLGDSHAARQDFNAALEINPNYLDAQYGLAYLQAGS